MQNSGSQRKRKLNNKGMSLLEVMIGIIILGIVSGALLRSFVVAMQANQSAKQKQRTTTAAQSIMEGFKAYDIEELCRQFSSDDSFKMMENVEHVEEITVGEGEEPAPNGQHIFVLQGVTFETKKYDARVVVTPKSEWTKDDMADFEEMNNYLDAVYTQPANQDRTAYTRIRQIIVNEINKLADGEERFLLEDLEKDNLRVDKKITVTIESAGEDGCVVKVKTIYEFSYSAQEFTYIDADGIEQSVSFDGMTDGLIYDDLNGSTKLVSALADGEEESFVSIRYNNTLTGAPLENVYIYYYPAYKDIGESGNINANDIRIDSEEIVLKNSYDPGTGEPLNVYVIKQVNSLLSNTKLNIYEVSYQPTVTGVIEGDGCPIVLYNNLKENLAGTNGPVPTPNISGVTDMGTLVKEKPEADYLVYDVEVYIYKEGKLDSEAPKDLLLQLNGSMNK